MNKAKSFTKLGLLTALGAASIGGTGCIAGDEEAKTFRQALQGRSVTVYPAVVRTGSKAAGHDPEAAAAITAELGKAGAKQVVVSDEKLTLSEMTSFNQSVMLKASLAVFGEHVKLHPPGTDYAAVAEYLTSSNGVVGGIHIYIVNADGTRAYCRGLNSHHKEYKSVQPRSNQQATAVLVARLQSDLQR